MSFGTWARRWSALGGVAAVAVLAATGGTQAAATAAQAGQASGTAAAATAPPTNPYAPSYQHRYRHGAVPTRAAAARMASWARQHPGAAAASPALSPAATADSAANLSYGGGVDGIGVTTGHEKVYLVFFGSQWGKRGTNSRGDRTLSGDRAGEAPYLQEMFKGLGTNGERWSGVMTQYCQGVAAASQSCPATAPHVAYPRGGVLAGVWTDESVKSPAVASGHRLALEAVRAATHFGNTTAARNRNAQYVIASPHGTDPDGWLEQGFCAWHDWNGDAILSGGPVTSPDGDIAFTNLPYVTDQGANCGAHFVRSGTAGKLDGVSIVDGHEFAETITDQNPPGGWTDSSGFENADLCAWIPPGNPGGAANLHLSTGTFAMQSTWSNDGSGGTGGCKFTHPIVS